MEIVKEKTSSDNNITEDVSAPKTKSKKFLIFTGIYTAIAIVLNLLAKIRSFSDFYTDHIFGLWSETYGRLTGLFPFSVGEIMIVAALILLLLAVVFSILLIFLRKKDNYKRFTVKYLKFILITTITVFLIMTLNCNIPYSCSKLNLLQTEDKLYSSEDLAKVRKHIIEECTSLAEKMERDENGNIIFNGDANAEVRKAMQNISVDYPRFKGYYPQPKGIVGSYFMYQSNTIGVYFPFSMEANYNTYLSTSYYPTTTAHELAHLKGYMFENEANFFAFLACTNSDCDYIKYSGYLGVLYYIDNDYYNGVTDKMYMEQIQIPDIVRFDDHCYETETVIELENKEPIVQDDVVESINETITDTYMDFYNVTPNYSEVTYLILQYYDGTLF